MTIDTWLRIGNWFAAPVAHLTVGLRTLATLPEHSALCAAVTFLRTENPEVFATRIEREVERLRPDLKGVIVIGVETSLFGNQIRIMAIHPSLPRRPADTIWNPTRCELLPERHAQGDENGLNRI